MLEGTKYIAIPLKTLKEKENPLLINNIFQ